MSMKLCVKDHPSLALRAKVGKQACWSADTQAVSVCVACCLQDTLAKQQSADDNAQHQGKLSDLDSQAEAAEQRILSLKKTILQNDTMIQRLIRMSVGAN